MVASPAIHQTIKAAQVNMVTSTKSNSRITRHA